MKTVDYQLDPDIKGDSEEDTKLLRSMTSEARLYLSRFSWCPGIKNLYLAFGIGGVVGLYLAELEDSIEGQDNYLWIVVGDVPSAYLVADLSTPREALEAYCSLMSDWVNAVESGSPIEVVFPVAAPPTTENAASLRCRLKFLADQVLPMLP